MKLNLKEYLLIVSSLFSLLLCQGCSLTPNHYRTVLSTKPLTVKIKTTYSFRWEDSHTYGHDSVLIYVHGHLLSENDYRDFIFPFNSVPKGTYVPPRFIGKKAILLDNKSVLISSSDISGGSQFYGLPMSQVVRIYVDSDAQVKSEVLKLDLNVDFADITEAHSNLWIKIRDTKSNLILIKKSTLEMHNLGRSAILDMDGDIAFLATPSWEVSGNKPLWIKVVRLTDDQEIARIDLNSSQYALPEFDESDVAQLGNVVLWSDQPKWFEKSFTWNSSTLELKLIQPSPLLIDIKNVH